MTEREAESAISQSGNSSLIQWHWAVPERNKEINQADIWGKVFKVVLTVQRPWGSWSLVCLGNGKKASVAGTEWWRARAAEEKVWFSSRDSPLRSWEGLAVYSQSLKKLLNYLILRFKGFWLRDETNLLLTNFKAEKPFQRLLTWFRWEMRWVGLGTCGERGVKWSDSGFILMIKLRNLLMDWVRKEIKKTVLFCRPLSWALLWDYLRLGCEGEPDSNSSTGWVTVDDFLKY